MTVPVFDDDGITLYQGDCLEVREWLAGDVLVTDPPYGVAWSQGTYSKTSTNGRTHGSRDGKPHAGIIGDNDTAARDAVLEAWGDRPALVFGDIRKPPADAKHALVYKKPPGAGLLGCVAGYRRDWEPIYLLGKWPQRPAQQTAIIATNARNHQTIGGGGINHPHRKPTDVMETLLMGCPPGVIVDPFAGSGSTLIAARNQGRQAIGVEIDPDYCQLIIRRLAQRTII